MSDLVTVVVSAGGASERMLRTCLCSLERHRGETPYDILVVSTWGQSGIPQKVSEDLGFNFRGASFPVDNLSGSRLHAGVLDASVFRVDTPYMLTLDADCFPITDDWLDWMMNDIQNGAAISGILHPYSPPPEYIPITTMDYRIRSQLCWSNTHVACQLIGMDTLKRLGVGFSDGDDTGLAITKKAREMGMKVNGLKVTGCAKADIDGPLEMNRESCLVFGDKVYHHGGGSREEQGKGSPGDVWRNIRKRVLDEGGAEFLLEGDNLYRYCFDSEEEVAKQMVNGIMNGMKIYLETHNVAFEE